MAARRLLRVGLTGGIATGKSHVLRRLARAGFATLDLDLVAHELMAAGGEAGPPLARAFGPSILAPDGGVDRKALGAIVFASDSARARLDAIVHPLVRRREAERARAAAAAGARVLVTDAALLVEAGVHLRFDRLLVSDCPAQAQLERLRARDGLGEAAARARLAAQMPGHEKREYAHFVIDTSGSLERTDAQVDAVAARLSALAPAAPVTLPLERALGCLVRGPRQGPRGLSAAALLAQAGATEGLDLTALARRLEPPAEGPWYRAARPEEGPPGPEALAGGLVLWCAGRGADAPFVLGAAASLARLTHARPEAVAGACVAALALWEVAGAGAEAAAVLAAAGATDGWLERARQRTGSAPPAAVLEEIGRAASGAALPGALSGALDGLARGVAVAEAPAELADLVRGLRLLDGAS